MSSDIDIKPVLAHYAHEYQPNQIEVLGQAGGFSGALFWRLRCDTGNFCLRRWPREHPSPNQLTFIHNGLAHVAGQGFSVCPVPIASREPTRQTMVVQAGHLWELTPWLSGTADYHASPGRAKLLAGMQMLARFHNASASFPIEGNVQRPSPGIGDRRDLLRRWRSADLQRLATTVNSATNSPWRADAEEIIRHFQLGSEDLGRRLELVGDISVSMQPVIRDVWEQHLLFEGETVSGLIDFGAMRVDNVAIDIARLLGSLAEDDQDAWRAGMDAYQQLRRLTTDEQRLISVFDLSIVLLSGLNWLRWLYVENRVFPDKQAVFGRLQAILRRLRCVWK